MLGGLWCFVIELMIVGISLLIPTAQLISSTRAIVSAEDSSQDRQFVPSRKVTDRVKATLPHGSVELAQPVRVPLELRGAGVREIYTSQDDGSHVLKNRQEGTRAIGNGPAKVVAENETGKAIEITPLQVGDIHLEVTVEFLDGAEETETYTLKVEPASSGLKRFTLNEGLKVFTLDHVKGSQMNERFLTPEAYY